MSTQLVTTMERAKLSRLVAAVRDGLPHEIARLEGCSIYWESAYGGDNGILGSFSVLKPNRIKLAECGRDALEMIASTLCHELRHRWQFQQMGLVVYSAAAIPFWRHWTIEPSAYEIEHKAEELIENMRL